MKIYIWNDRNFTYVGIWNHSDADRLRRSEHQRKMSSPPLDLRYTAAGRYDDRRLLSSPMETLVSTVLEHEGVTKDTGIGRSNWNAYRLSHDQVLYAYRLSSTTSCLLLPDASTRLFAARGVKSTIITTPVNALHIADSIDRDKQSGLNISIQTIPFPAVEVGLPEGTENVSFVSTRETVNKFFDAVGMLQHPLEQLVEEHCPDCIVADVFMPWTTDVAEKYGIPKIVFNGTCYFSLCLELIRNFAPHVQINTLDLENCVLPDIPTREDQMRRLKLLLYIMLNDKKSKMDRLFYILPR